jgi:hypothetical protein
MVALFCLIKHAEDRKPGWVGFIKLLLCWAVWVLQEQGLDTVDANRALGLPDDCREYTSVRNILRDLQVRSVKLMVRTSNCVLSVTVGYRLVDVRAGGGGSVIAAAAQVHSHVVVCQWSVPAAHHWCADQGVGWCENRA